ncbi:MAG: putative DNA repair protein [Lysobacterales bacterium]|jgi:probable DNA repair protein
MRLCCNNIQKNQQAKHINKLRTQSEQHKHISLVPDQQYQESLIAARFRASPELKVIQAPEIFTLSQWVQDRSTRIDLLNGKAAAITPDQFQIRTLWDFVISNSIDGISPEESYALAGQAVGAELLSSQWDPNPGLDSGAEQFEGFGAWRAAVKAAMKSRNWLTGSDWMIHFSAQIEHQVVPAFVLPEAITLFGFVEFSRMENHLIDVLRQYGVKVVINEAQIQAPNSLKRSGFQDTDLEINAAAQWLKQHLDAGCTNVALIVNGIESIGKTVERVLENHFSRRELLAFSTNQHSPFCLQSPQYLIAQPIVSDALLLISLSMGGRYQRHEFPSISKLLLSGNLSGAAPERFARARLEHRLRESNYFLCSLPQLSSLIEHENNSDSLSILRQLLNSVVQQPSKNIDPADQIVAWLRQWGWPGSAFSAPESSASYREFLKVLEKLKRYRLSDIGTCFTALARLCGSRRLPHHGGAFSPLQVISPEQAYGRHFDAAWVANTTMENWPPRPVSNPFLSAASRKSIPRATEDGMLSYTKTLNAHLLQCAADIQFSWCDRVNDLPVSASPLITEIEPVHVEFPAKAELWSHLCPDASNIKNYHDHPYLRASFETSLVPFPMTQGKQLRKVVSLLNMQSACPLAAFTVFRLAARMERPPGPFANHSYRGILVHAALEYLYRNYCGTKEHPDVTEVPAAVHEALISQHAEQRLLPAVLAAERHLIEGMLLDWLVLERKLSRGEIAELEWRVDMQFAGFDMLIQIDRIDRLSDGRVVLVDYKTGAANVMSDWGQQRLRNVQLPLYATLIRDSGLMEPAGICFANVHLHEPGTQGLADEPVASDYRLSGFENRPGALAKKLGSWSNAIDTWDTQITSLMAEFIAGDTRHLVFHEAGLRYADLSGLLRTEEIARWLQEVPSNHV